MSRMSIIEAMEEVLKFMVHPQLPMEEFILRLKKDYTVLVIGMRNSRLQIRLLFNWLMNPNLIKTAHLLIFRCFLPKSLPDPVMIFSIQPGRLMGTAVS